MKHKNDSAFIAYCTVGNCMYSTRSWNAYKLHFRKKHPILKMDNELNATLHLTIQKETVMSWMIMNRIMKISTIKIFLLTGET